MKRGERVINLSKKIAKELKPSCKKIEVVGSVRRKKENPKDIDIVLIPKKMDKIIEQMNKLGKFLQGGEHESTWNVDGIKVELYYTNEEEWGAALLAYSSKKGSGIGLRIIAKMKGFKLNNHGLFNRKTGKRIAGKTEREIYSALGRPYKEPWER
ncbi:MAG: hypothetical protein WC584_01370 [Candidatus Pacearchaeota archaeon]